MTAHRAAQKREVIRLRVEERLGLDALVERTGLPHTTVYSWVRGFPLTDAEIQGRRQNGGRRTSSLREARGDLAKGRGPEADLHQVVRAHSLTGLQVAKVSEAAVLLRLLARGFNVFGSVFDGDRTDWIVEVPSTGKVWKIQVKTTLQRAARHGLPTVALRHASDTRFGARRYKPGEFDFIVGYDLYTDTAYVWSWAEVVHLKAAVTVCPEAAERWDKLLA